MIRNELIIFLEESNIINYQQHDLRKVKSCTAQLLECTEE